MKTWDEVSPEKLRGGFYTPDALVRTCLDRIAVMTAGRTDLRLLEPSAGDGAFLRGLRDHTLRNQVDSVTAIEILPAEAAKCEEEIAATEWAGRVINTSALGWFRETSHLFDIAVGNPPFVRFQFVNAEERVHAATLGDAVGARFKGVSNLWLPLFIGALSRLVDDGAFSFVVPSECFTGISGNAVREWLLANTSDLEVDLFPPKSFPGVLQEVVILSGRRSRNPERRRLSLRQHSIGGPDQQVREWVHDNLGQYQTWTRYLLPPRHVESLRVAEDLRSVKALGEVAKFEVATVTGANAFFCVDREVVEDFGLSPWTRPLLPRTRHATGLTYSKDEYRAHANQGVNSYLLDFSDSRPDPESYTLARQYLRSGESDQLDSRFKCRIRDPWYRVPVVAPGQMMMAKRSHVFPRVIVNDAEVVTTDTIYRGRIQKGCSLSPRAFTAAFHNSLTLLSAEIEGRSFGGGVLELVPSEISRLMIPVANDAAEEFDHLDWVARDVSEENPFALIEATDSVVSKCVEGLTDDLFDDLRQALLHLRELRLSRN